MWLGLIAGPEPSTSRLLRLNSASAPQTSALTPTRGRLTGGYGTTWSSPLVNNGSLRSCRVGQRKVKKAPCNSLFKHDRIRPTLSLRKHVLTCNNRTDLVIHDPHRPNGAAHLIRVRSMVQVHLEPLNIAFLMLSSSERRHN